MRGCASVVLRSSRSSKNRHVPQPVSTRRAVLVFIICAIVLFGIDRLSKIWAVNCLPEEGMGFIPGIIGFALVFNSGGSFGMFQGATWLFLLISTAAAIAILIYLIKYKKHTTFESLLMAAVFSGALGNAFDRFVNGMVTDFIYFKFVNFAVFNVADICITTGVVLWLIYLFCHPLSPVSERGEQIDDYGDLSQSNS